MEVTRDCSTVFRFTVDFSVEVSDAPVAAGVRVAIVAVESAVTGSSVATAVIPIVGDKFKDVMFILGEVTCPCGFDISAKLSEVAVNVSGKDPYVAAVNVSGKVFVV